MTTLLHDLRYALRMLLKNPGFTAAAMITLALGIGANSAIFSVVNAVLLRPLPYQDPDQLVMVWENNRREKRDQNQVSFLNFADWREQNQVFVDSAAFSYWTFNLTGVDQPERLRSVIASASFFNVLGVKPKLGRTFNTEEDQPGNDQVVVLSHSLWQRRFGSDPNVIGKSMSLSGGNFVVIGVMHPDFNFPAEDAELWVPLSAPIVDTRFPQVMQKRDMHFITVVARLKPDISLTEAQSQMSTIGSRLETQYPDSNTGYGVNLVSLYEQTVANSRPTLLMLVGVVSFVLLIASANVANLLLARAAARQKEIAIRAALGAGRLRIIRQLLTESVLLAALGGVLGLLLAYVSVKTFVALGPTDVPRLKDVGLDGRVLLFSLLISLLTGIIFGLAPALQASRSNLNENLKEGDRGSTKGGSANRMRNLLVVIEVALSVVLLIGAGLTIKSFSRLQKVDPGFDSQNVLTMRFSLTNTTYPKPEQQEQFYRRLSDRLAALPGVQSVGAITFAPLTKLARNKFWFIVEGQPVVIASERPQAFHNAVTPDYFRAMGISLLKGRYFTEQDKSDAPGVIIINQTLARRFFPNQDPVGKRLMLESPLKDQWLQIVGVVNDVRQIELSGEAGLEMYTAHAQSPAAAMFVVMRTATDPLSFSAAVGSAVRELDNDQPMSNVKTMDQLLGESVAQPRFRTLLLGVFALVVLVMGAVGIYGVLAFLVKQRTHEMGIRMALGAQASDILKLVVGQGMLLVLVGIVLGLVGALALTRVMASLLYGVEATDPAIFILMPLLLGVVAFIACFIPARRASKIDPMVALRYE
ncbi:MAG: ABC transporter permease [Pyrinomonadaceae bacterium]|nr:ABC transporter permease [Pyrinomonadaceae bacterium]